MTQQNQIHRKKLVFKVLVIGYNLELQAGFLNRASTVPPSFQLYPALGLGIGVARVEQDDDFDVAIQLWSLPLVERCEGLTSSFVRGHRAVIAVITPDEIPRLPEILDIVPVESYNDLMVILVTDNQYSETLKEELSTILGYPMELQTVTNVQTTMSILVNILIHSTDENCVFPLTIQMDSNACPIFCPIIETSSIPLNTEKEIELICDLALDFGYESTPTSCTIELKEGVAEIDLLSGTVSYKPKLCTFCEKKCKRIVNICIVRKEQGWSSIKLGNRALLTIAKMYALANGELPEHVEKQIARAARCQSFKISPELFENKDLLNHLIKLGYVQVYGEWTLLDEAAKRAQNGRLSVNVYNTIRILLERVHSSYNSSCNNEE